MEHDSFPWGSMKSFVFSCFSMDPPFILVYVPGSYLLSFLCKYEPEGHLNAEKVVNEQKTK